MSWYKIKFFSFAKCFHPNSIFQIAIISVLLCSLFLFWRCNKGLEQREVVIAQIGNRIITVRDFRLDYEFGFSHLKTGSDRKRSYLDRMIGERVLALRGYELGLDKSKRVQKLVKALEEELVIEQVFIDNVNAKVKISDQEIQDAINKSKVSWKLRYWFEPNKEFAESVCEHMREHGYAETVDQILSSNPEVNLKPSDFETQYLTWLDVSPEILEAIKNLHPGEISDPVEIGRGYYIFQLVDIRQEPVTEYEYASRAGTYRKILQARREQELAKKFISSLMTPKNVVTKGDVFADLAENLYEWYKNKDKKDDLNEAIEKAGAEQPYLVQLRQNLDRALVTFEGGKWTVKDFLKRFNTKAVSATEEGFSAFRTELNQQIALTVRNHFLLKKGYSEKVHLRPAVRKEISQWTDKWVYRELRQQVASGIEISDEEAPKYFAKFKDRYKIRWDDTPSYENNRTLVQIHATRQKELAALNSEIASLKERFGITINQAVLDTITTIEFQKSHWATLNVFKRSSNRMAYPVTDPNWVF